MEFGDFSRGRGCLLHGALRQEKIVERHFRLDDAGMLVRLDSVGRHHRHMTIPRRRIIGSPYHNHAI